MTTETITWTPSSDRLPDDDSLVLVHTPDRAEPVDVGFYFDGQWRTIDGFPVQDEEVVHWAVMPVGPVSMHAEQAALEGGK